MAEQPSRRLIANSDCVPNWRRVSERLLWFNDCVCVLWLHTLISTQYFMNFKSILNGQWAMRWIYFVIGLQSLHYMLNWKFSRNFEWKLLGTSARELFRWNFYCAVLVSPALQLELHNQRGEEGASARWKKRTKGEREQLLKIHSFLYRITSMRIEFKCHSACSFFPFILRCSHSVRFWRLISRQLGKVEGNTDRAWMLLCMHFSSNIFFNLSSGATTCESCSHLSWSIGVGVGILTCCFMEVKIDYYPSHLLFSIPILLRHARPMCCALFIE